MTGPGRDRQQPGFVVNIGHVHRDNYSVAGDLYIGAVPDRLRDGLRHPAVARSTAREAHDCVDDIDDALRDGEPDRHRIARALERLTHILSTTGTLVAAGAALVDPMTGLAVWLGNLGKSVLDQLPRT